MPSQSPVKRHFDLQVEHFFLRLALRRISGDASADVVGELEKRLESARLEIGRAVESGGDQRSRDLVVRMALQPIDGELLWLAAATSVAPELVTQAEAMIGSSATRGVSLALLALATDRENGEVRDLARRLDGEHPLLSHGFLLPTAQQAVTPVRTFRLAQRVVQHLAGDDSVDPLVAEAGGVVQPPDDPEYDDAQRRTIDKLAELVALDSPVTVVVEGARGAGRRTAVAQAAVRADMGQVVALDVSRSTDAREGICALQRESLLRNALPVVGECGHWRAKSEKEVAGLLRPLESSPRPLFLTSSDAGVPIPSQREIVRIYWPLPGSRTRRALWERYLSHDVDSLRTSLDELSVRYRLGPGGIRAAARASRLHMATRGVLTSADVVAGVRSNVLEDLGNLARRVSVTQSWNDLVLAEDATDQVNALIARVRHAHTVYETWGLGEKMPRGKGVSALFVGPPGTGKTMVAGLIAKELDLELYQVDLSKVVSKWVGETEKQLSKIFDAAEAGHALLLFDEADALFAKRTEVKAAVDRYANLEVNYLLQRIETFGGITILTTNLDASIDPALRRRLSATVVFELPDEGERVTLWRKLLDARVEIEGDLDVESLARDFSDMSGANIRNAVVGGAFLAASEKSALTQEHLTRAARGEYRTTMGRVLC